MAEDVRIPLVPNPAGQESGGVCSTVEIEVGEKSDIAIDVLYLAPTTNVPDGTTSTQPHEYLIVQGTFGGGITDWLNGQVVFEILTDQLMQQPQYLTNQLPLRLIMLRILEELIFNISESELVEVNYFLVINQVLNLLVEQLN